MIRVSVTLVQVDAVVTDSKGRHVTDLKAQDFEILQDGKPQKITHFSYISPGAAPRPAPPKAAPPVKTAPALPPVPMRPQQVRRTVAFVVDDLGLSFESIAFVRRALKKFVDEQMEPGDLAAIIRTGAGMGAFQQFTSDKRQLYAAIERVRWNFLGRGGISAFAPIQSDPLADAAGEAGDAGPDRLDEFREEYFSVGTLGALNFIVRGLKELPGRKSVILLSDNLRIFNREGYSDRILESLQRLTDLANRSSVVIYTMDARGLPTLSLTAADRPNARNPVQLAAALDARRQDYWESQNGLNYLADQTGGLFIQSTNDLNGGIRQVLDDSEGYYLIGYQPGEDTFRKEANKQRFHSIKVKVKRPGLHVRSRNGFFGVPDQDTRPVYRTREQQLAAALISPFGAAGIPLRLTALFANSATAGSFVYSLLHIGAGELAFTDEPDGWHKAVIDILTITYGAEGEEVDRSDRTYTVRLKGDTYQKAMANGFIYSLNHPVKKAGAYQLRAAVRDAGSAKVGAASQFLEIPDVKKGRLALSGIVLKSVAANKAATGPAAPGAEGSSVEADPLGSPAMRIFHPGASMVYAFQILNAQTDPGTKLPQLNTQLRLFRNGQPVYTGKLNPVDSAGQTDFQRLLLGGRLQLSSKMEPGEYVLQLVATDKFAKEKNRTAAQWIDFEVVR